MAPEAEPKPYKNQKRIVDKLPETRLESNHYITTDPEWARTMGAEGSEDWTWSVYSMLAFWQFDRRVTTICPVCKVHLCADGCFLQWHRSFPVRGVLLYQSLKMIKKKDPPREIFDLSSTPLSDLYRTILSQIPLSRI